MFCNKCGTSVPEESDFCLKCGSPIAAGKAQAAPAADEGRDRDKGGGFWHSGAAIALIAILGVAVLAGIVMGIIALTGGESGDDKVDSDTIKVWDEYESLLEEYSSDIPDLTTDTAELQRIQEELRQEQAKVAALQEVLAKTGGSETRRSGGTSTSKRDVKADQLEDSLDAYYDYVKKMEELFAALNGANLNDPATVNRINQIIADLNRLGAEVMNTAEDFLDGNAEIVETNFSPDILTFGDSAAAKLKELIAAAGGSTAGSTTTTPTTASYAGQYAQGGNVINLYPDGTYNTLNAEGNTTAGVYSVSGNIITFVGSDGGTGTGTITSNSITNSYGTFVKR